MGRIRTAHFGAGSDPSLRDTDGDGLEDGVEEGLGLSAISSDTDGDGLPDTWELDNGLDPLAPNGPDGADSDGDGVSDGAEVDQSSDPADASDGGVANSRVKVPLYFGDPSGSSSEKYRVDLTCVEGTSPSHYRVNSAYGRCDPVEVVLKPGSAYDVTIRHAGTKPLLRGRNGYPDYDYELTVLPAPPEVLVEDPQGLLGYHENDGARFPGKGKTARISALTPPSILAPDVVGVNDDDDDGNDVSDRDDQPITQGDDDLAEIKVRASFPGLLGWGIRFYLYSGATCATIWKDRLKTEFVNVGEMIHMEGGQLEKSFYLEGLSASRRFNDSQIKVELVAGGVVLECIHRFTVVKRIVDPLSPDEVDGVLVNPCCAVSGMPVAMKVDALPDDFPDTRIKWEVLSGTGFFFETGTGRRVSLTPIGSASDILLGVRFGDAPGMVPRFRMKVRSSADSED